MKKYYFGFKDEDIVNAKKRKVYLYGENFLITQNPNLNPVSQYKKIAERNTGIYLNYKDYKTKKLYIWIKESTLETIREKKRHSFVFFLDKILSYGFIFGNSKIVISGQLLEKKTLLHFYVFSKRKLIKFQEFLLPDFSTPAFVTDLENKLSYFKKEYPGFSFEWSFPLPDISSREESVFKDMKTVDSVIKNIPIFKSLSIGKVVSQEKKNKDINITIIKSIMILLLGVGLYGWKMYQPWIDFENVREKYKEAYSLMQKKCIDKNIRIYQGKDVFLDKPKEDALGVKRLNTFLNSFFNVEGVEIKEIIYDLKEKDAKMDVNGIRRDRNNLNAKENDFKISLSIPYQEGRNILQQSKELLDYIASTNGVALELLGATKKVGGGLRQTTIEMVIAGNYVEEE
jgi:hypothetical protein